MHILRFFSMTGEEIWKVEALSIEVGAIMPENKIFYIKDSDGLVVREITVFEPGILTLEKQLKM